jgi:hypothetical protein
MASWMAALAACGGAPAMSQRPAAGAQARSGGAGHAGTIADDSLPSLDAVAALGATLAPGMRELARRESSVTAGQHAPEEAARAASRDLCARVAYAADGPVGARLEDGAGGALAEAPRSTSGALGEEGPVCVRHGELLRVVFDAGVSARVRWVTWVAP